MSGVPPPPVYQSGGTPPAEGTAVAALILAIASFVICPIVPAIVALVLVSVARQKIASAGGGVGGENLCQIATIVAWVNIGLFVVLAMVAFLVLVAAA